MKNPLNILLNIGRIAKEKGYAQPEEMQKNQEDYMKAQGESENVKYDDGIIVQYGGGRMFKPGSYDRYTPFRLYPDADFLVIAWPMGLVQASCNPFKKERALKGINLGEIAKEVLQKFEPTLKNKVVPLSVIKRVSETKAVKDSIGFKMTDLYALYGGKVKNLPKDKENYFYKIITSIMDKPWKTLSDKQKEMLDKVGISAWDVVESNSGGHKCITNISGLSFYGRAKRDPQGKYKYDKSRGDSPYVALTKNILSEFVRKLKEKIELDKSTMLEFFNKEGSLITEKDLTKGFVNRMSKVIKREFSYFELENVKGDAMLKERFDNFMSLYGIKNDKVIKRIIKEINL